MVTPAAGCTTYANRGPAIGDDRHEAPSGASHTMNLTTTPSGATYEWKMNLACLNGDSCVPKL